MQSEIRDKVVLVTEDLQVIGEMDKLEAHQKGVLHLAFSVFIFNSKGELLIHQRAAHKYHGANLWTNTCCSHPQLKEDIAVSAQQRLSYEMGLTCSITEVFSFIYNTPVENNLIEHEYDFVYVGYTDQNPVINPEEVQAYVWVEPTKLLHDIEENPSKYTYWFKKIIHEVLTRIKAI